MVTEMRERRIKLESQWLEFLGHGPESVPAVTLKTLASEEVEGCVREKVVFQTHPGCAVEAYLLRPARVTGKLPGVLSLHQTIECTIDEAAGLDGCPDLHIGLHLAQNGYVTFNPRCFLWGYQGLQRPESTRALLKDFPRWKGMGKMLWDAQRSLDILASLDYVDPKRLGVIGHSLGGKEAFYLAAFDRRVKAAVASEMGIGFDMSNWNADHYLGPDISSLGFPLSHHDLLELIAPTPFILIGGDCADGEASAAYIDQARTDAYAPSGAADKIAFLNHHQRHKFPQEARKVAYAWLDGHLRPKA